MKILVLPREETNPYQELLYEQLGGLGAHVSYLSEVTPSHTINLLLLPLETVVRRLGGAKVVHLHWVYAFSLYGSGRSLLSRRAAEAWFSLWLRLVRLLGLRLVWTAHNVLPLTPVFADDLRARRRLAAAADLVIAHSAATLEQLAGLGMSPRRSAVIPHGPFAEAGDPAGHRAPGDGQQPRQFLFLGKIRPYKGVDLLLEAFAALPPELGARLTVAGECGDQSLAAELTELAARSAGRVTLRLEWVADDEAARLLYASDAMVLPYRHITTSGSGLLGLGHGRPLVVPDLPGLAELPGDAVVRYDGTAAGLRAALAEIITADAAALAKMSSAAYAYSGGVNWKEIAKQTMTEVAGLLAP